MGFFLEVFGTDFFLALSKEKSFFVVFVDVLVMTDTCFGSVHILLLFIFVRALSFVIFCFVIRVPGLGVFFRMVGYLLLLVLVGLLLGPPLVKTLLVLGWRGCWVLILKKIVGIGSLLIVFVDDVVSSNVSDHPDVWTDGSFVQDELSGVGAGGCGVYSSRSGAGWFHRKWGHLELLPPGDLGVERCVLFDSIRGPLQRAELWGVIFALQCSSAVHLGVDNLSVVRHVSRILEGRISGRPFELTFDGDLLIIIERMILLRGVQNVKITKVKGHADDDMVAVGRVRVEDRIGNDLADRAADFGRRRVSDLVIDVRRRFLSACSSWYPVVLDLHRFFNAIARAAVNNDGCAGVALHPTVWSSGGPAKKRKFRVSAWEFAWVPGPVGLWRHGSFGWPCTEVGEDDVGFWPYSVGLLVKFCFFLSSLHWPSTVDDLGVGERWAGERLVLEMSVPKSRRLHRPISVSAVPDGPSIDIWRSCRFFGFDDSCLIWPTWWFG